MSLISFSPFFIEGLTFSFIAVSAFVLSGFALTFMILTAKKKLIPNQTCQIEINENEEMTKEVMGGQTLLSALCQEGIAIPSPCGGKASCKQCRIQIQNGAAPALEIELATFTKKQIKEGWRLSCQFKVKQNIQVCIENRFLDVKEWEAEVISNHNVATFIKELIVKLPEGVTIPYKSGGYVQFIIPPFKTKTSHWKETMDPKFYTDWEKFKLFGHDLDFSHIPLGSVIRAYSLASYPAEGNLLKFNIRIASPPIVQGKVKENIPWGISSSYTFGLKPKDKIRLSGPYGESFMINDSRPLIFLIGGAGSSFGRSHVLQLFYTENTKRRVDFWYGARSLKENIYQKEYETLAKKFPNFRYHLVLSEPLPEDIAAGWQKNDPICTNFLFRAFEIGQLKGMEEPEEHLYYVCGPPLHNTSVLKLLDDYGVPRENIVLDDFGV